MSRLGPEEVREIAVLARLALGDQEIARMTQDLDAILGYVEALRELDTRATLPMTHAVPFDCPLRPDVEGEALSVDEALRNAPGREANFFAVPRIIPLSSPSPASSPAASAPLGTTGPTGGAEGGPPGASPGGTPGDG